MQLEHGCACACGDGGDVDGGGVGRYRPRWHAECCLSFLGWWSVVQSGMHVSAETCSLSHESRVRVRGRALTGSQAEAKLPCHTKCFPMGNPEAQRRTTSHS